MFINMRIDFGDDIADPQPLLGIFAVLAVGEARRGALRLESAAIA